VLHGNIKWQGEKVESLNLHFHRFPGYCYLPSLVLYPALTPAVKSPFSGIISWRISLIAD
jgi:hypothetical protein